MVPRRTISGALGEVCWCKSKNLWCHPAGRTKEQELQDDIGLWS